ncbi:medium-chain acyl-CoA ligase ACSF2, mitochondrial isoform X2 [Nilaparvata lugens]|uniref:medium-chain acyl-CoA ligase ACSF2, mitochondrial isoform X2 n=1 Tax=Nilaparvata lugens TaxID=108931 RepID=UPI00193DAC56|nr:medium-chain acyl-CoA ligase ACSF2, mitochondrial isoform X2 [Nilaparvata lugens]
MVDLLAQGLLDIGLSPGDHLGIWGVNTNEWVLTLLAAAKVGIVSVTMNPAYEPPEVKFCIGKTNMKGLVFDSTFRDKNLYEVMTKLVPEMTQCEPCTPFRSKEFPDLTHLIVFSDCDETLEGTYRLDDVFEAGKGNEDRRLVAENLIEAEDPWNIQFTSGTTGDPKAAVMSHFANVNNSYFVGKRMGLHLKNHVILCQVPFFHVFGSVLGILGALNHGAALVLPGPLYHPDESVQAVIDYKCTVLYGTPTMYVDLCAEVEKRSAKEQEALKKQGVEVALTAGALCSPVLLKKMHDTFELRVFSLYGMTEAGPCAFQSQVTDTEEQITTTVGSVAENVEIKVVDSEGRMVPMGQPGECWFKTYACMIRYWDDEQKTREALTETRWLKSGDQFILTEDGFGKVVGRVKDLIIRGGENIAPKEVEEHLEKHPSVREVHVYAVSDERLGEDVAVSIRLKEGTTWSEDELRAFCKGQIAHFKIPKYIEFVEDFPKTTSGKIQKFKLREMLEKKLGRKS